MAIRELSQNLVSDAILRASGSAAAERAVMWLPPTRHVVERFVAGAERWQLLPVVRNLLSQGKLVSVDFLGEETDTAEAARHVVDEYIALVAELGAFDHAARIDGSVPAEVSVKLSAIGLGLSRGAELAAEYLREICQRASDAGVLVTVDAESSESAAITQAIVRKVREDYEWLGAAVQAYRRDAAAELDDFVTSSARIRLCKGAYRESATEVFTDRNAICSAYQRCISTIVHGGGYPMIATHDPLLIEAAHAELEGADFEYQMLFGVRTDEQDRLVAAGHPVRVYVPYGDRWYRYLMRRLAERPANLAFFARAVVGR